MEWFLSKTECFKKENERFGLGMEHFGPRFTDSIFNTEITEFHKIKYSNHMTPNPLSKKKFKTPVE